MCDHVYLVALCFVFPQKLLGIVKCRGKLFAEWQLWRVPG